MSTISRRALLQAAAIAALFGAQQLPVVEASQPPRHRPLGLGPIGELTRLPGDDARFALTVDDGLDTNVVSAFVEFCRQTETRLTFFVNGKNESWTANASAIRPLVESGQIQVANHTWSHPDITKISSDEVARQIDRNARFMVDTFGVDGTPYFRPPYGQHNDETDRIAAELGYTSIVLWSSSMEDWQPLPDDELIANAQRCFQAGQIVLSHANLPPITQCYAQLEDLIRSRALQTVTLTDVYG